LEVEIVFAYRGGRSWGSKTAMVCHGEVGQRRAAGYRGKEKESNIYYFLFPPSSMNIAHFMDDRGLVVALESAGRRRMPPRVDGNLDGGGVP
jgi:hypothetical protein